MAGRHVSQLLLRAYVNEVTRDFCEEELSIGAGAEVILYCTSTAPKPHLWNVYLCPDGLAEIGVQGYVLYGTMFQAALDFYGITIDEELLYYPLERIPVPIIWWLYPDLVWGAQCIGVGVYYGNNDGVVDLYYQTTSMMNEDVFHHVVIYHSEPNEWYRGERRYYGLVQRTDLRRPAWLGAGYDAAYDRRVPCIL